MKRPFASHGISIVLLLLSIFSFKSTGSFDQILHGYKMDELRYFSEVAFLTGKISRWSEPIRISQEGSSRHDEMFMRDVVSDLEPLLSGLPISTVPSAGNIIVHYTKSISEYSRNYRDAGELPLGYAIPKFSSENTLIHADIYLHPSLLSEKRKEVLIHEICHTLGLLDHPSTPYDEDSIMSAAVYRNKKPALKIPRLDKAALRLLYDKRMPDTLLKTDFMKKLSVITVSKT